MLRLSRLADYGIVLLAQIAGEPAGAVHSARELGNRSGIPLPTVSKLLKTLAHARILESVRGPSGGYRLARSARRVTVEQVITALEGPIAVADCVPEAAVSCEHEAGCPVRNPMQAVNSAVLQALRRLTLAELAGSRRRHEALPPSLAV